MSLNSSIDRTFYLENIVFGDINRVEEFQIDPGGKGINVARMVHILGGKSIGISFLGGKNGTLIKNLLEKENIKLIFIRTKGETRNIFNFIEKKTGKILRINEKGPKILRKEKNSLFNLLGKINFSNQDIFSISGSLPQGMEKTTYKKIIKKLKKKICFIALDSDGEPLKEGIKAKPFLIKPNLWELERLVEGKIDSLTKLKNTCEKLLNFGISIILLTLGEKGAVLFSKGKKVYAKPPKVKLESDVGCGDAFLAGFLYKFSQKEKLEKCLKFAVASGTAKAMKKGTSMPTKNEVLKLVKKVKFLPLEVLNNIF